MSDQVVIVGGGLSGLVTAYELHQRGIASVVLEAAPRTGGRIGSVALADGGIAERAAEEFWTTSPVCGQLDELGLPTVTQPALSSVVIDGRLHAYPSAAGPSAYLGALFGLAGLRAFEEWCRSAHAVLHDLDLAAGTGRWTARLRTLMATSFPSYLASSALPHRVVALLKDSAGRSRRGRGSVSAHRGVIVGGFAGVHIDVQQVTQPIADERFIWSMAKVPMAPGLKPACFMAAIAATRVGVPLQELTPASVLAAMEFVPAFRLGQRHRPGIAVVAGGTSGAAENYSGVS
jgi:hypothetical protein